VKSKYDHYGDGDGDGDMNAKDLDMHGLCNRILEPDRSIRFVGIPNKMGRQIISSYRSGLKPLLTRNEIEMFDTRRIEDEYKKRF
ncbi:MAG: hypothetical protein ACR2IS_15435, partial [Nitrososphaeraceae archaeon]